MIDFVAEYDKIAREVLARKGEKNALEREVSRANKSMGAAEVRHRDISDSIILVQKFSEGIKTGIVGKFEELLTRAVREIFEKDYKVNIEMTTPGNTMHAEFYVTLPDGKKVNLAKGEGGGLRDVVAVMQRILYIVLEPARPSRILFFDENLKHLDAERSRRAFPFIAGVLRELGIQTMWITHSPAAISMEEDKGVSVVRVGDE